MEVTARHPDMTQERVLEWQLMRDAMAGESAIKVRGETYLPKPSGFKAQPDAGAAMYLAYQNRAQFPEILAPSVAAMIGIVHGAETHIELPAALEYLNENADGKRLTLDAFHRRITRALLVAGRYGVLADAPEGGGDPYLVGYTGESIINWDVGFYVLDETGPQRSDFQWSMVKRYRVLQLVGGAYEQTVYEGEALAVGRPVPVTTTGGKRLIRIPFDVANARDVTADVATPPLIGVARAAKAIYQLSADYRHQLYMSGQETLVAINGDAPSAVGAGVVHSMQGAEGVTPDLKYVSPTCSGIEAHKIAMEDNRTAAVMAGARLLEQSENVQESGSARKLRFASETATLTSVAQTSCALLERALRNIAAMKGINEAEVTVTAPKDLLDRTMTPADAQALMALWTGGGIGYQTFYENLQAGGIASPDRTFEEEQMLLDAPDDLGVMTP